jgi:hypothetical protein
MYASAFLVHVVLKLIPLGLFILDPLFRSVFSEKFSTQLVLLFIVVEFWWTKNITGKRMLGVTWFFSEDIYKTERLMFECRSNEEDVYAANTKLFWIVQFGYIVTPFLLIIGLIIVIPYAGGIPTRKVQTFIILDSDQCRYSYQWSVEYLLLLEGYKWGSRETSSFENAPWNRLCQKTWSGLDHLILLSGNRHQDNSQEGLRYLFLFVVSQWGAL